MVSLLAHAAKASGGLEPLVEAHPFLGAYLAELVELGFEGQELMSILEAFDRELAGKDSALVHPLDRARAAERWIPEVLTGWMWCGLSKEDPRFGPLLDSLLGRSGLPTRATLSLWLDDDPSVGQLLSRGWLEEVEVGTETALRVPQPLWDAARGRHPAQADVVYHPLEALPKEAPIFPPRFLERIEADSKAATWILQGGRSSGRTALGSWIARRRSSGLVEVGEGRSESAWIGPLCTMLGAVPIHSVEVPAGTRRTWKGACGADGTCIVRQTGSGTLDAGHESIRLELSNPDRSERIRHWSRILGRRPSDELLDLRIARGAIHGLGSAASDDPEGILAIRAALADRGRYLLEGVARQVPTPAGGQKLELGADSAAEFAALVSRCRHRERLLERLPAAFGHGGAGVRALFKGPSGTGKTLAARRLAEVLGRPLWRVDLSAVVSKWIGETEKNLEKAFHAAESLDIVLLLDEGDALLSGRTAVSSSTDRYANLETNFLLQRLESFDGVLVATTNAADRIDPAFLRRFDVSIDFPVPDPSVRLSIWKLHLPRDHRVSERRLEDLARRCELSGGLIRNAALHATLLSLEADGPLSDGQILEGVRREYRRAGLSCPSFAETGP